MATQLHKRFSTEEVKVLFQKYLDEKVKRAYILEILKIKRSRETYPGWAEPDKLGQEKWDYPHKRLRYQIRSYLVPSHEFKGFF